MCVCVCVYSYPHTRIHTHTLIQIPAFMEKTDMRAQIAAIGSGAGGSRRWEQGVTVWTQPFTDNVSNGTSTPFFSTLI